MLLRQKLVLCGNNVSFSGHILKICSKAKLSSFSPRNSNGLSSIILSTALNTESLEIEQRICQRLTKCNDFPDHCWGDYLCNFLCGTVFVSLRSGWPVKWLKWTEDGLFGTGKVVLVLDKNSEWCKWLHSYWWSVHVFLQAAW